MPKERTLGKAGTVVLGVNTMAKEGSGLGIKWNNGILIGIKDSDVIEHHGHGRPTSRHLD